VSSPGLRRPPSQRRTSDFASSSAGKAPVLESTAARLGALGENSTVPIQPPQPLPLAAAQWQVDRARLIGACAITERRCCNADAVYSQ
jgi:hypothetical protein